MSQLGCLARTKPQQLNGFWQQMPPHIRGLLCQHDGQWRLVRSLVVFDETGLDAVGRKHGFRTVLGQECTSSDDVVLEWTRRSVDGVHKFSYVAHFQSKGRGRQGKSWHNRSGERPMFSFGWSFDRRQNELGALALVAALACNCALAKLGLTTQIK